MENAKNPAQVVYDEQLCRKQGTWVKGFLQHQQSFLKFG